MTVLLQDFLSGNLGSTLASGASGAVTDSSFAGLPVVAGSDTLKLVLDPDGTAGDPEIITITAHTSASTTATISRASEGTTAREHLSSTKWVNAVTTTDFNRLGFDGTIAADLTGNVTGDVTGNVTGDVTGALTGNAATATKWAAATTLTVDGDVSGSVVFDGSDTTETLTITVTDDSHSHTTTTIGTLDAGDVTTGTFHVDRIPNLSGAKINSGIVSASYIDTAIARLTAVYGFDSSSTGYNITASSGSGTPSGGSNGDIHIYY